MKRFDFKTLITILFIFILFIFAFILSVGYVLSNIDPKNKLQGYAIAISFIGIFATFSGAYLGAKISGENASKLAKKENMINDLRNTLQHNNRILDEFNNHWLNFELETRLSERNFNNALDIKAYYTSFFKLESKYDNFLKRNDFGNIFPLLSYEFDELKEMLDILGNNLRKCIKNTDVKLEELVREQGYYNFTICEGYEGSGLKMYQGEKEGTVIVEIKYNNEIEKVKIDLIEVNKAINYTDMENVNLALKNAMVYWDEFKFKSKKDIRDFIAEYYGDYE